MLGVDAPMLGTYWAMVRPDGTPYGECPQQGIIMTRDGDMGARTGAGMGQFTGQGSAVSLRGAIYFRTPSPKLARLNEVSVHHEWDSDEHGNAHAPFWEWK
jgi:hypothetical protein